MRLWVGVTDYDWFQFLAQLLPDEVNFWQPSGRHVFHALEAGGLFLFKLHRPHDYIVGGGFFIKHSFLPLSIAWEAFGQKNGAATFSSLSARIKKYRETKGRLELDPVIGCIVLANPFFWSEKVWIPVPPDWRPSLVQGKTYDTETTVGSQLWAAVEIRLHQEQLRPTDSESTVPIAAEERARYGAAHIVQPRLGQGAFRVLVTDAYNRQCAITGERTLPVLDAAHIKPYSESGPHRVSNGLLLRSDLHTLFDRGYLTVTQDLHIEVSRRIKEEYENGRDYYALHGKTLRVLPAKPLERPSPEFIDWHNRHVYFG